MDLKEAIGGGMYEGIVEKRGWTLLIKVDCRSEQNGLTLEVNPIIICCYWGLCSLSLT